MATKIAEGIFLPTEIHLVGHLPQSLIQPFLDLIRSFERTHPDDIHIAIWMENLDMPVEHAIDLLHKAMAQPRPPEGHT